MFKNNVYVSDKKRFLLPLFLFITTGLALFLYNSFLKPQIIVLLTALTSSSSASIWLYGLGWVLLSLLGILWLGLFILNTVSIKEFIAFLTRQ